MKTLRIFISSPGDVSEERDRARQVVESLRRRYGGKFFLKPMLWEDLPLQPDMSFQQGIDFVLSQERGVDIAVFILWSRLGSPIGALIQKPSGGEYRSGTEREFDLMMQARKQSGGERPHILIYTRSDEISFDERLRGKSTIEKERDIAQKKLVEQFIAEEFHDTGTGTNIRAYHSFDRPVTFSQRLRTHLQEVLDELAGGSAEVIWDIEKQGPPFMGLESFQPQHADVFFGREEEILEARHALREQARNGCAFLLLSGASASGKSSLARAGILPAIRDLELDAQVASWRTIIVTPAEFGSKPFSALVNCLTEALPCLCGSETSEAKPSFAALSKVSMEALAKDLQEAPAITVRQTISPAFSVTSAAAKGAVRLLLLIDQLEEFFASTTISAEDRSAFFAAIEALARSGSVWVIATVRSDFYLRIQSEPALVRMKSGFGQLDILPPGPDALRRLIEEPARLAGLTFEVRDGQSLADRILRDTAAHAELLPLLEFVLRELYEQRSATRQLTFTAYEALGGVEGALARHAESVFRSMPGDSQESLAFVLQSLVTLGHEGDSHSSGVGEGERLVRQRAPLHSFAENPAAQRFVTTFIGERLFTSDQASGNREPIVTVAHESLLRVWPRAVQWAEQNRELLRTRARIAARMKEGSPLLEGDPLLPSAQAHVQLQSRAFTPAQLDYIRNAVAAAQSRAFRAIRLRRIAFVTLALLTLFAIAGAIFGWLQADAAATAAKEADHQRGVAVKSEEAAKAETVRAKTNLNKALSELDRASLEEGKVWLERARTAQEKGDNFTAIMLAGRAVGFRGYGAEKSIVEKGIRFHSLLGLPLLHNPDAEAERQIEQQEAAKLIGSLRPTFLPCWIRAHSKAVMTLAFSPDGASIASGSSDHSVKLWDASTGKELASFVGHKDSVNCAMFSPDGLRLATGSGDKSIKVWDVETGKELFPLSGHTDAIMDVAFSPDGSRLASASEDGTIKLWDTVTTKELATIRGHEGSVYTVAFSPNGNQLASGSADNTLKIWDAVTGQEVITLKGHADSLNSVAFSPDGDTVVSSSWDHTLKIWSVSTGKELATMKGHEGAVWSAAFSPDGRRIASGSSDNSLRLWDTASGKEIAIHKGHLDSITAVVFSPDGSRLASASSDNTLKVWDVASPHDLALPTGTTDAMADVVIGSDGKLIARGTLDNTIKIWDRTTATELATFRGHEGSVYTVAVSPDGLRIASGSSDNTVKLWDLATGNQLATLTRHNDSVNCLAFSRDGRFLASGSEDRTINLWDVSSDRHLVTMKGHDGAIQSLMFNAQGTRLASGSSDRTMKVWETSTGTELATYKGHEDVVVDVSFLTDGLRLQSKSADNVTKIWDALSGLEIEVDPRIVPRPIPDQPASELEVISETRTSKVPQLLHFIQQAVLAIDSREVIWKDELSIESINQTSAVHYHEDPVAQLAEPTLPPDKRGIIRLHLCAKAHQWRAGLALWKKLVQQTPALLELAPARQEMLILTASSLQQLAHAEKPSAPPELLIALTDNLRNEDFANLRISLSVAAATKAVLAKEVAFTPALPAEVREAFRVHLLKTAPGAWREALIPP